MARRVTWERRPSRRPPQKQSLWSGGAGGTHGAPSHTPQEVIEAEIIRRQRGHLNIIHQESQTRADIYLFSGDPFQAWAYDHAVHADIGGLPVAFAPPEYTILMKLEFYREGGSEKHLRDIHGILSAGEPLRTAEVARFVASRGLEALWEKHVLSRLG